MKRYAILILLIIISLICCKCSTKPSPKTSSTGRTLEIMTICEDKFWNGEVGNTMRKYFMAPQDGLPQEEPKFLMIHFRPASFRNYIKKHRNVIIVEFNPGRSEPRIAMMKDAWASPQIVFKLLLKDEKQFYDVFEEKKSTFEKYFREVERLRIIRAYKSIQEPKVKERLRGKWGLSMVIPLGFYIASEDKYNIWLRKELKESSQGLLIHQDIYDDTSIFNLRNVILLRDSLLKSYIPGPDKGTYMITEKLFPPLLSQTNINGNYAIETRGLWKVEGMFYGGGPFINYLIIDKRSNRFFMVDGYVFAPKDEKRNFLLQVEAIIYSLKFLK